MGSKKIKTKTKSQNLNIMKKVNLLLRWSTSILPSFKITYLLFLIIFLLYGTSGKISYKGKKKFEDESTQKLLLELLATLPVGYFRCVCVDFIVFCKVIKEL